MSKNVSGIGNIPGSPHVPGDVPVQSGKRRPPQPAPSQCGIGELGGCEWAKWGNIHCRVVDIQRPPTRQRLWLSAKARWRNKVEDVHRMRRSRYSDTQCGTCHLGVCARDREDGGTSATIQVGCARYVHIVITVARVVLIESTSSCRARAVDGSGKIKKGALIDESNSQLIACQAISWLL